MIAGVPGHPLFIHAAVVFAPVAALTSMWWAVRPERKKLRKKLLPAAVVINFFVRSVHLACALVRRGSAEDAGAFRSGSRSPRKACRVCKLPHGQCGRVVCCGCRPLRFSAYLAGQCAASRCCDCCDCSDCDSRNDWPRRCWAGLEGLNERKSSYWAGRCGAKLAPWKGSSRRSDLATEMSEKLQNVNLGARLWLRKTL